MGRYPTSGCWSRQAWAAGSLNQVQVTTRLSSKSINLLIDVTNVPQAGFKRVRASFSSLPLELPTYLATLG
jgi:hypothetical protein